MINKGDLYVFFYQTELTYFYLSRYENNCLLICELWFAIINLILNILNVDYFWIIECVWNIDNSKILELISRY